MIKAEIEEHDRDVATRVVGCMITDDVTVAVDGDALERMIIRVMGAMQIARAVEFDRLVCVGREASQ